MLTIQFRYSALCFFNGLLISVCLLVFAFTDKSRQCANNGQLRPFISCFANLLFSLYSWSDLALHYFHIKRAFNRPFDVKRRYIIIRLTAHNSFLLIGMNRSGDLPTIVLIDQRHKVSNAKALKLQYNFCNHIICRLFNDLRNHLTIQNFSLLFF